MIHLKILTGENSNQTKINLGQIKSSKKIVIFILYKEKRSGQDFRDPLINLVILKSFFFNITVFIL